MDTKASNATNAAAASSTSLTLTDIYELANQWAPERASWDYLLDQEDTWGPAHELGHALVEPRWRHRKGSYGRCATGQCECRGEECDVHEVAAMMISQHLVTAADRSDLVEDELWSTENYDKITTPYNQARARALLKRKGLWPIPKTRRGLEAALKRRFGRQ